MNRKYRSLHVGFEKSWGSLAVLGRAELSEGKRWDLTHWLVFFSTSVAFQILCLEALCQVRDRKLSSKPGDVSCLGPSGEGAH